MTWAQCCTPILFEGGVVYRHSTYCPIAARQKLTAAEELDLHVWRERRRVSKLPTIDELAAIADAVHEHPSGTRHLRSVKDPDYIEAHLDDADDDGEPDLV